MTEPDALQADAEECEFRLRWEIDVSASSSREAAEKALQIQRKPDSIATVFDVVDRDGKILETVDLTPDEEDALPAAPHATAQRLFVEFGNPHDRGPVVSLMRLDPAQMAQWDKFVSAVKASGAEEGFWVNAADVAFLRGTLDRHADFANTTGLPEALFERMSEEYEDSWDVVRYFIDGVDIDAVFERVKQVYHSKVATADTAEICYADGVAVKSSGAIHALYEEERDDGLIRAFSMGAPLAWENIPTLQLDEVTAQLRP